MTRIYNCLLPIVVTGTVQIVPIYFNEMEGLHANGRARSIATDEPEYTGPIRLNFALMFPDDIDSNITFIGPEETTIRLPLPERLPHMGISHNAPIYTVLDRGFILYPGRLRNEFTENTQYSMVLNPVGAQSYCIEGSLFYIQRSSNWINVETTIVGNDQQIDATSSIVESSRDEYSFQSHLDSDVIPIRVANELFDILLPDVSLSDIPDYLEDCDLVNGNYPSIHFRILESIDNQHKGTIVYGPDDYLEPMRDGRCRIKVKAGFVPLFGPNFFSKISTHFTSDRIGFCDPLV